MAGNQKDLYGRVMDLFSDSDSVRGPEDQDQNELANKALSYARGAGGNTGMGDAVARNVLQYFQDPNNTYAGASAGDTLSKDSDEATRKYPTANRIGGEQVAGSLSTLANMAVPGAGGPIGLAGRSLLHAIPGALHGAYTAGPGQDRTKAAAVGAATSAAFPLAEAASGKLGLARSIMNMLRPGAAEAEPVAQGAARPNMRSQTPPEPTPSAREPALWERTPTIPPDAAPVESKIAEIAERNRTPSLPPSDMTELPPPTPAPRNPQPMLPPPDDGALDSMLSTRGLQEPKLPAEFRAGARPGVAPDESLFPAYQNSEEAMADFQRRRNNTDFSEHNAGFKFPKSQPQYGPQSRGRDIMDMRMNEPAISQDLPTRAPEYSTADPMAANSPTAYDMSGARGQAAMKEFGQTAPPASAARTPMIPNAGKPPSASPSGEFDLTGPRLSGEPPPLDPQTIPPAPNQNTLALPPGGKDPTPGYLQRLDSMEPPIDPSIPQNAGTKIGNEDFKREFNKKHDIGGATARPKPKKRKPKSEDD